MRQFKRSERVGEQILRVISKIMETELAESAPGMVTFTRVQMSADLRYATVYYSFLGSEKGQKSVDGFMERQSKRIRRQLGSKIRIRHIPELRFEFDPSVQEGARIEQLLNEIKSNRTEHDSTE